MTRCAAAEHQNPAGCGHCGRTGEAIAFLSARSHQPTRSLWYVRIEGASLDADAAAYILTSRRAFGPGAPSPARWRASAARSTGGERSDRSRLRLDGSAGATGGRRGGKAVSTVDVHDLPPRTMVVRLSAHARRL